MKSSVLKQQLEEHSHKMWKDPQSMATCLLLAYDELKSRDDPIVNNIYSHYINELRYYLRQVDKNPAYKERISGVVHLIGVNNINKVVNRCTELISKESGEGLFF